MELSSDERLSAPSGSLLAHKQQARSRWVKDQSAGGCRNCSSYATNPKFWLRLSEPAEVLVCLMQYDPEEWSTAPGRTGTKRGEVRVQERRHQHAIGLHMWKVGGEEKILGSMEL